MRFQRRERRVAEAVRRLTAAGDWDEYAAAVTDTPRELLWPVEERLTGMLRRYREAEGDDSGEIATLEQATWVLNAYRTGRATTGWPFGEWYQPPDHLVGPLETVVNTAEPEEVRRAVAGHPELLTPETGMILVRLEADHAGVFQHTSAHQVARRRRMLAGLRHTGDLDHGEFVPVADSRRDMAGLLDGANREIAVYRLTGDDAALDRAAELTRRMTLHRMWHQLDPEIRRSLLHQVASALQDRYEHRGDTAGIEAAVHLRELNATQTPLDHVDRPTVLGNLGNARRLRYAGSADPADLDAAVRELEDATVTLGRDDPVGPLSLNNLGNALLDRYLTRASNADLDRAFAAFTLAVRARDDAGHPMYLNNLSRAALHRYLRDGADADLRLALQTSERTLVAGVRSPQRPHHLAHAAEVLRVRFHRDRDAAALHQARAFVTEAKNLGDAADLDLMIALLDQAVDSVPPRSAPAS